MFPVEVGGGGVSLVNVTNIGVRYISSFDSYLAFLSILKNCEPKVANQLNSGTAVEIFIGGKRRGLDFRKPPQTVLNNV